MGRIIGRLFKVIKIAIISVIVITIALAVYHQVMLRVEEERLLPPGKLVVLNFHEMHVYAEGDKRGRPSLLFLSGSGTPAPIYDFKALYSILSEEFRIVVVERPGYGYSESTALPRDLWGVLGETREALSLAGEEGPYILFPHSMSGLEALFWASEYPEEIKGIVGLDMAVPESYEYFDIEKVNRLYYPALMAQWLGFVRLIRPFYPMSTEGLTPDDIEQQKLLFYRNASGSVYFKEGEYVLENAKIAGELPKPNIPILMFSSDGNEIGDYWLPCQERFASAVGAKLEILDCGHYVHDYKYEEIARISKQFILEGR